MTTVDASRVRVETQAEFDAKRGTELLTLEQTARWALDRSTYATHVHSLDDERGILGAALVTARPGTNSAKIVDVAVRAGADDGRAAEAIVEAVVLEARVAGLTAVKWEHWVTGQIDLARRLGFVALDAPLLSGGGTTGPAASILRFHAVPVSQPPYYAQTTDFTCGAVSLLAALEILDGNGFSGESTEANHREEMTLWRTATNFPACEPIGLAVAAHHRRNGGAVSVRLDSPGAVLLEAFPGAAPVEFRAQLQRDTLVEAEALGIPIVRTRITSAEIADLVDTGAVVLLLIDLTRFHGISTPHWVVAHSRVGNVVILQDPWVDDENGETWVDGVEVPVTFAELDDINTWGEASNRGAVILPKP